MRRILARAPAIAFAALAPPGQHLTIGRCERACLGERLSAAANDAGEGSIRLVDGELGLLRHASIKSGQVCPAAASAMPCCMMSGINSAGVISMVFSTASIIEETAEEIASRNSTVVTVITLGMEVERSRPLRVTSRSSSNGKADAPAILIFSAEASPI